jgi:hypothetical protein
MILLRWFITVLAIFALPYFVSGIGVSSILSGKILDKLIGGSSVGSVKIRRKLISSRGILRREIRNRRRLE